MDRNNLDSSTPARNIGNFTKDAVKEFEQNIVSQHNFLEKSKNSLNNNK